MDLNSICSRDPIPPMSGVKIFVAGSDVWRPVLGYEGFYEVSGHGEVRALAAVRADKNGRLVARSSRMLRPQPQKHSGRRSVMLSKGDGTQLKQYVYVLVAEAFLGPRPEGKQVGHRNDIAHDDRISNLHYVTNQENSFEKTANGRNTNANKTHCKRGHPLSGDNVREKNQGLTIGRYCVTCDRASSTARYEKVKAAREAARQSED